MSENLLSISPPVPSREALCDESFAIAKQASLLENLGRLDSLLIAFSGGADSAYLAWAAHRAIGHRALSVTALSASFSQFDRENVDLFVRTTGIRHEFIETQEFANPLYVTNNPDRCYHCKDELFARMQSLAASRGFAAIAYGINADDTRDFRPGHRAAHVHRILSPLLDTALGKKEIRHLSRQAGLSTWDRPASPCLSSRIPYGTEVTAELLQKIERAESAVRLLGFRQFRVRAFGDSARIELSQGDLARGSAPEMARALESAAITAGFASAEIDPQGYRQGSLNSLLKK